MGKRSPVLGYNHNFKHRGLIFHVQTEDSGVDNPHLFTHLFHGGVIISSRRMDYDNESEVDTVKGLMQSQHKAVLKDLKIGTFDEKIDAYLGNHADLLPRKIARSQSEPALESLEKAEPQDIAQVADTHPSSSLRLATEVDDPNDHMPSDRGGTDEVNTLAVHAVSQASDVAAEAAANRARELAEAAAAGAAHARELQEAATAAAARAAELEAQVRESTTMATQAESAHSGAISLDGAGSRLRSTPTAVDVQLADHDLHDLGDPKVTFGSAPSSARSTPPPTPPPIPSPAQNIPDSLVSERSGTYSMKRASTSVPERLPERAPRRGPPPRSAAPKAPPAPARAAAMRPGGKAANPEPGRPRSPVVVSRPAVIIGAPPKMVGKDRKPVGRKARANVFGKDLISEKSLDEVIMAYLSEDSSESDS